MVDYTAILILAAALKDAAPRAIEFLFALAYRVVVVTGPQVALVDLMVCARGHRAARHTDGRPAVGAHLIFEQDDSPPPIAGGGLKLFVAFSSAVVAFVAAPDHGTAISVCALVGIVSAIEQNVLAIAIKSSASDAGASYRLYVSRRAFARLMARLRD